MSYENQGNNKNLLIVLSIALALLIASLLYVWNDKRQMQKQASELIAHKDAIIDQTRKDLEVFRGRNLQLDSLVLSQEDALESKSRIIDSLYRIGRLTGSQLEKLGYMPLKFMEIQLVPKTLAKYQSCIPVHGDVVFVPNNSAQGREIIERDVEKWFASLCMHGYMDFALWQIEELKISKPPLVTETEELLRKS